MVDPELVAAVRAGDRRALARALSRVEDDPDCALVLDFRPLGGRAHIVGVTGAAGTGKSTLVAALATELRRRDRTVGILAVDPTSPLTGGALLGDRVRMGALSGDPGVFIRSMAHRGGGGGLARATLAAACVLDAAGFDVVLIETLGAGQDEVAVAAAAHTTVVLVVPGMGDAIQALKAGIIEVADVFALNKADAAGAEEWEAQLRAVLDLAAEGQDPSAWRPPVVRTVATGAEGVADLVDAIAEHGAHVRSGGRWPDRCRPDPRAAVDPPSGAAAVPRPAQSPSGLYGELVLASGTANERLAGDLASCLAVDLLPRRIRRFPNSNTFVRLERSVRGADVFWVQPTGAPANDNLMELLIAIDTLRRDSAARITAVVPYFGYGRSDKKDQPRVPITARLVADLITVAGADRLLTMDLHADQIQGFFRIPVDDISARRMLVGHAMRRVSRAAVVVAPDIGRAKSARNFAQELDLPLAVVEKRRVPDGSRSDPTNLIGTVAKLDALIFDDEIDTAETLVKAARFVKRHGAQRVVALATHGIFSAPSVENLRDAPIEEIVVTNTVEIPPERRPANLVELNVAATLAEVIRRIHVGQSVGALFDE